MKMRSFVSGVEIITSDTSHENRGQLEVHGVVQRYMRVWVCIEIGRGLPQRTGHTISQSSCAQGLVFSL